jgi:hypothetical protein
MNYISRFFAAPVLAVILVLTVVAQAGPHSHPRDEDGALALLERTLKHDGVYTHRISLDCVTCGTEEANQRLLFNLSSAKIRPNAVETLKRVR